ncbi:hypothetical protein [Streptomyces sp. OR43]|uniref:hypothetical protein n=1 Tax=Streptomyces sp. or43 TaxID=2478957 RepID=UPI0011CE7AC7|nr:hypothetical protein [Streptomyces sp. or43]TXS34152.1 hypothetical protein EAO72_41420 [Streptomyces sp. or43]
MDATREAEQIVTIEAARAYVASMDRRKPFDLDAPNAGQLLGHLMSAEVLLMKIARAFDDSQKTER